MPVAALERLGEADAFGSMGATRRDAIWAIRALRDTALPLFAASDHGVVEPAITMAPMRPGRTVVEDYGSVGLSLRQHPIAFVRDDLAAAGHGLLRRSRSGCGTGAGSSCPGWC